MEKKREMVLETYVFDTTKSVQLLDRFEGLGEENNTIYERMILKNCKYGTTKEGHSFIYHLVIERSKNRNYVGDITFTKFKKGQDRELRHYICEQINKDIINKYAGTKEIYYFEKPFLLRAQNTSNRTGYGWEWNWSGGIGTSYEGTFYGETTSYVFAGVIIEKH